MISFVYENPTRIVYGNGSIEKLGDEILNYGTSVLLVYGGRSIRDNGTLDCVRQQLDNRKIRYQELGGVKIPSLQNVREGIRLCHENDIEAVIGIGGGCCIDTAKSIATGAANDMDIWDVLTGKVPYAELDALPIGTVVTIAGSGSEMDGNSEIVNEETGEHGSIGSFIRTYPKFSILDPELTLSVPFEKKAYHGMCIVIQALEQYLCNTENTPIQDGMSEAVIRAVLSALDRLKADPKDLDASGTLMWASALVTNRILCRGKQAPWMAGPIGGVIEDAYDLAYTQGIVLTFPKYMKVCCKDMLPIMKQFAINVMHVDPMNRSCLDTAKEGVRLFQKFIVSLGLPETLAQIGVEADLKDLMKGIEDVSQTKKIQKEDLIEVMKEVIGK